MEFRISINEKAVFALLIVVAMVSAIGITLAQTPNPGHSWSQIECSGCIGTADVNFNYAGSDSKGGSATSADSVPWSGVTGSPPISASTGWPDGSYCIFRSGGSCPSGFTAKSLGLYVGQHAHDMCAVGDRIAGDSSCSGGTPMATLTLELCCK